MNTSKLSFAGLLRSEWIKLWSLRSTWWCLSITVALTLGIAWLVGQSLTSFSGSVPTTEATGAAVTAATAGTSISLLVIAVLGALSITGEFGTGSIRTSFLAAPRRYDVLGSKALVLGIVAFVVGLLSTAIGLLIAAALLSGAGIGPDLGDPGAWFSVLGAAGSMGLIAVFTIGVGAVIRSSAGTITIAVGVLFVLPIVLRLVVSIANLSWLLHVPTYLPSALASDMATYGSVTAGNPIQWLGALLLAVWAAVLLAVGSFATRVRDA